MATKAARTVRKLDLRKQHKDLYAPSAKAVTLIDVPELLFTMVDGVIEPGRGPSDSEGFRQTMEAMYGVGYGLKFMSKLRAEDPLDFTVMAIEGLWEFGSAEFSVRSDNPWRYTLLMLQPDHITDVMFEEAVEQAAAKRSNPVLQQMRLERWQEGLSIQIMHIGPYADEPRAIEMMDAFAAAGGYRKRGRHHEIYMGDPRRAAPAKLKTILRQPVEPN
ncbi:MAG: GyrI-like domain-containing protein [Acidimicrobiia bacterium]|nr:GyrI-like domain-containing protein [Acidimicrobiia bacterium]